jgi:hypothetical protein
MAYEGGLRQMRGKRSSAYTSFRDGIAELGLEKYTAGGSAEAVLQV